MRKCISISFTNNSFFFIFFCIVLSSNIDAQIRVIDNKGTIKNINKVTVSTIQPQMPESGEVWIDTSNSISVSSIYDGTQWHLLSSPTWFVSGNTGTDSSTDFIGTTDNQDLIFRTNDTARLIIKSGVSRMLLANPGTFMAPNFSSSAVLGIDGTNHSRFRITSGDDESFDDSQGASIDLHANSAFFNAGILDLVAGSIAQGNNNAIRFWTNTGTGQQVSAVITGQGAVGIGNTSPNAGAILDLTNSSDRALLLPSEMPPQILIYQQMA